MTKELMDNAIKNELKNRVLKILNICQECKADKDELDVCKELKIRMEMVDSLKATQLQCFTPPYHLKEYKWMVKYILIMNNALGFELEGDIKFDTVSSICMDMIKILESGELSEEKITLSAFNASSLIKRRLMRDMF